MKAFDDESFQKEVLDSETPVLVDFFAPWCRPCHVLTPIIEKVAGEFLGCKVGKMNIDENPQTTGKFSVFSIPTLIFFKGGKEVKRLVGLQEAQLITETLQGLRT